MTDIVDRLREPRVRKPVLAYDLYKVMVEAADEIERLRALVTMYEASIKRLEAKIDEGLRAFGVDPATVRGTKGTEVAND